MNEVNLSGIMYINSTSGYVGIGTSQPNDKLDIRGNIVTPQGMVQTPYGGIGKYENLAPNSEAINSWTSEAIWNVTINNATAPDGQLTAERISHNASGNPYLYQFITNNTAIVSTTWTFSVWLKGESGGESVTLNLESRNNTATLETASTTATLTTSWQRFSVTKTFS